MKLLIFILFLASMAAGAPSMAEEIEKSPVAFQEDFSGPLDKDGLPKGWKPLFFKKISRHTRYIVVRKDGKACLKAESDASASGIYRELSFDPQRYRYLSWRWRVQGILGKGDARKREGDDYPARIYVSFEYDPDRASTGMAIKYDFIRLLYGQYPPSATITYIWANRLPKGDAVPSAYAGKAVMMVAVESGMEKAGQWVEVRRDVYADYRNLFKAQPPKISGIGIMTDTDDTGEKMTAWYADIMLSSKLQEK